MVVFVASSVFAGMVTTSGMLLTARAAQAVGAAMIMPSTLSTVNAVFRGKHRAMAFGIWGAVISGAAAIGPLAGGALTQWASWRWIFFVNLPIGVLLVVAALMVVPETHGDRRPGFDYLGFLLSATGLGTLVFAIIEGPEYGWWQQVGQLSFFGVAWPSSFALSAIPFALLVSVVNLTVFVWWELRRLHHGQTAVMDLRLFALPTFSWGNLTAAMVAVGEFALLFVLPLFLINALGLSVMQAGVILAAMAAGSFASGGMARHVAGRLGSPGTVILGLALELTSVLALSLVVGPETPGWVLAIPLVFYGLGLGLASAQLTGTVLRDVPVGQSGQGSAAQSTVRQVGSALGTAIAGGALAMTLSHSLPNALARGGFTGPEADQLAEVTRLSAGSNLAGLRADASAEGVRLLGALVDGLAEATRAAMMTSSAFLLIGLAGSIAVFRVASRTRE
nr:MFS_1 [uncultured bacterium]